MAGSPLAEKCGDRSPIEGGLEAVAAKLRATLGMCCLPWPITSFVPRHWKRSVDQLAKQGPTRYRGDHDVYTWWFAF